MFFFEVLYYPGYRLLNPVFGDIHEGNFVRFKLTSAINGKISYHINAMNTEINKISGGKCYRKTMTLVFN